MITIKSNGSFSIPKGEGFIGYAGDNLKVTKEIFVEGIADLSLVYRIYLLFDDGTCNYFLVDSEVQTDGTLLTWNVTNDQIYKSGVVQVQIKASNSSGEVFHSNTTTMLVQTSIEFSDYFKEKENSEYLQHQEYLNDLLEKQIKAEEGVENSIAKAQESVTASELAAAQAQQAVEDAQQILDTCNSVLETANSTLDQSNETLETANTTLTTAEEKITEFQSMSVDTYPYSGSTNLITSGAVYNAVRNKMNYSNVGNISDITTLAAFLTNSTIYYMILLAGASDDIEEDVNAMLFNLENKQLLHLADGRVFIREKQGTTWTAFEKVSVNSQDLQDLIDMYSLDNRIIYQNLQAEQTVESLKDYKSSDTVCYFVLSANELNNTSSIVGISYVVKGTQVIKLMDGSEFTRTFSQRGTTTTWTDFVQTGFNSADMLNQLVETGSGTLTSDTEMASSATYNYCKVGNMVTVVANVKTAVPTDGISYAQFSGLPYSVSNGDNLNRTMNSMCISVNSLTYRAVIRNTELTITQLNTSSHAPMTPTVSDTLTVTLTYFV